MANQEGTPDRQSDSVIRHDVIREWSDVLEDLPEAEKAVFLAQLPEGSNIGAGGAKTLEIREKMGRVSYAKLGDRAIRDLIEREAA
jgi:hypothetical protein